jgi:nucleoside 2-deoxyribosyltransferase
MKVGILGSMHFSEKMLEVAKKLEAMGHEPILPYKVHSFIDLNDKEKETIKLDQKHNEDAIRHDYETMGGADVVLVLNFERHGIQNYLGGNTLLDLGFAHIRRKPIYLYNPIPEILYYRSEIEAMKPTVINGDLSMIT